MAVGPAVRSKAGASTLLSSTQAFPAPSRAACSRQGPSWATALLPAVPRAAPLLRVLSGRTGSTAGTAGLHGGMPLPSQAEAEYPERQGGDDTKTRLFPETLLDSSRWEAISGREQHQGTEHGSSSQTSHTAQHPSSQCPILTSQSAALPPLPAIQGPDPAAQAKGQEQAEAWSEPSARPNRSSRKTVAGRA